MAYKFSKGSTFQGDIYNEDDHERNTYIDFGDDDYIGLVASGSSVLVVSGSHVGIGTDSPGTLLEVSGGNVSILSTNSGAGTASPPDGFLIFDKVFDNSGEATANKIVLYDDKVSDGWKGGIGVSHHDVDFFSGENFRFWTGHATDVEGDERFTILEGGNVGIGTDAPDYALDVAGTVGIDSYLYHNGDGDTYLKFTGNEVNIVAGAKSMITLDYNNNTNDKIILNNTNADIDVQIMADDGIAILHTDAATNMVGIGTVLPQVTLDVHYTGSGDPINLDDDKGGGEVVYFGTGSLTAGALHYLNEDGGWAKTLAAETGQGHDQLLGIPLGTSPAGDGVLLKGYYHADTYFSGSFRKGKPVYICSTASGYFTGSAPTGSHSYVRIVGYGTNVGNVIYFNPSSTYIEIS